MRAVRLWHRMPREAVGAPSLEVPKARLDGAPGQPELLGGSQTRFYGSVIFKDPSNPTILWLSDSCHAGVGAPGAAVLVEAPAA